MATRRLPRTHAELDAEVNRRVSAIVKEQDVVRQLEDIKLRLDKANGLKAAMVTKEDFRAFEAKFEDRLRGFVTVQDLGDGDFVVKHKLTLLDPDDQHLLHEGLRLFENSRATQAHTAQVQQRRYRTWEVYALIASAALTAILVATDLYSRLHR